MLRYAVAIALFAAAFVPHDVVRAADGTPLPRLKISENGRFIVQENGKPFFYLGDTAWELFHRLNLEEATDYLNDRAAKKFTVIQAVGIAEYGGLIQPNTEGQTPLINNDPTQPNPKYFEHVDAIVHKANALGMYIGFLPTWGDKFNKKWGEGPEIFTPENAAVYGEWLGNRYKKDGIIWILGGDRPIENENHKLIVRAMAEGLRKGDGGAHLCTMHPMGGHSSAEWLHDEKWLDFNMLQSGHGKRNGPNWSMIAKDYARTPAKPTLDGEPNYEDHPINWKNNGGWFDQYDVRKTLYRSLLSGACGYTYGCHDIWQFLSDKNKPVSHARTPWREAIKLPGSGQVQYARTLLESRPWLELRPAQDLIASGQSEDPAAHMTAALAENGSFALIYTPQGKPFEVNLAKIGAKGVKEITASWFDTRTGQSTPAGKFPTEGTQKFEPPADPKEGNDWLLVIDRQP